MRALTYCFCVATLVCLIGSVLAEKVDYSDFSVIQVIPKSQKNLRWLEKLEQRGIIKFWLEPRALNHPASFQISSKSYEQMWEKMLKHQSLNPTVLISNIQELIDKQDKEIQLRRMIHNKINGKAFDFENFHPYNELTAFMRDTAASNPLVSYSVIGQSYEGTDIGQVTVSTSGRNSSKPIIFLECGIHAREWVAPSTCIWIFDQLASGYGVDQDSTDLLDKFDWIIVPSTNPDGYNYTWAETSNRLWRKNRAPTSNAQCMGIDLNRNYAANFGGEGSSSVACSETYHGTRAFSESESVAIRDSLAANRGRVKAYVSLHSYGGFWMSPYGYLPELPTEYPEMLRVMEIGVAAITQTFGTRFTYGNEAAILYLTSGTSRDYTYVGEDKILYPYTIETRDRAYGFVAPPSEILPTAQEVWNGIKAMAYAVL